MSSRRSARIASFRIAAIVCVLVDLPGPEQRFADPQARFAEGLLGAEAFGVGFEVALQVRPTDLAAAGRQMTVGPPAIGEVTIAVVWPSRSLGVVLMTISADAQDRMAGH